MELQHINAKIFVDGQLTVPLARFIEVFHGWVAEQTMDLMMIDVADYRHVPSGPGVVMVGLEADYSIDQMGGHDGLRYNRKSALDGSNVDRFLHSLQAAYKVCGLLEDRFAELQFSRREFELFVNDRALAPHTDETNAFFKSALESFLSERLGQQGYSITIRDDPRALVGATVSLSEALDLAELPVG